MRERTFDGMPVSALGFGCGSVMGRVGRRDSLRAMGAAWDEGITLFDTARSYGFGEAEGVLGEFLRGKRERAVVATKFGIAPQTQGAVRRAALPVVRAAMQLPGVKSALKRGSRAENKKPGEFSAAGLRLSLEESLRQLRTEYVDVLFLHEATAEALRDDELMAEAEAAVRAGKVRRVGLYGDAGLMAAALNGPEALRAMQFGGDCFNAVAAGLSQRNARELFLVANHPFGNEARVAKVKAVLADICADEDVVPELRDKLRGREWSVVLEAVVGMALRSADVLVFSMMQPAHLRENARAVEGRFTQPELELIQSRMLEHGRMDARGYGLS